MAPRSASARSVSDPTRETRARTRSATSKGISEGTSAHGESAPVKARTRTARTGNTTTADTSSRISTRSGKQLEESGYNTNNNRVTRGRSIKILSEDCLDEVSSDDEVAVVDFVKPSCSKGKASASNKTKPAPMAATTADRAKRPVAVSKRRELGAKVDCSGSDGDDDDELAEVDIPRKSSFNQKATPASSKRETSERPMNTAGRRRKKATSSVEENIVPSHIKPETGASKGKARVATTLPKKVTFLDLAIESDKENQPLPISRTAKRSQKSDVGMKAKPIRKASSGKSRGQISVAQNKNNERKKPLSPRKAAEANRSASSCSSDSTQDDDELCGPRLRKSNTNKSPPTKFVCVNARFSSPAKRIGFTEPYQSPSHRGRTDQNHCDKEDLALDTQLPSPQKLQTAITSPPRRPPPSPFKDAMKESPRRAPVQAGSQSEYQHDASNNERTSPLKEAPKKCSIVLGGESIWSLEPLATPSASKDSLLQSPPKRVLSPKRVISPPKFTLPGPKKPSFRAYGTGLADSQANLDRLLSPTRQTRCPTVERSPRRQNNLDLACNATEIVMDGGIDFEASVLDIRKSFELPICTPKASDPELDLHYPTSSQDAATESKAPLEDPFIITESSSPSSTPAHPYEIVSPESSVNSDNCFQGVPPPAPSPPAFASPHRFDLAYRDRPDPDESDDELTQAWNNVTSSPSKQPRNDPCTDDADMFMGEGISPSKRVPFTPLLMKLSKWGAQSPVTMGPEGLPPPAGQNHVEHWLQLPGEGDDVRCHRRCLSAQPPRQKRATIMKTSFSEEEMAIRTRTTINEVDPTSNYINRAGRKSTEKDTPGRLDFRADDIMDDEQPVIPEVISQSGEDKYMYADENEAPLPVTISINRGSHRSRARSNPLSFQNQEDFRPLPMIVTPARARIPRVRTFHTVSRVPLMPEGDGMTLKIPKKRTRSLSPAQLTDGLAKGSRAERSSFSASSQKPIVGTFKIPERHHTNGDDETPAAVPERPKQHKRSISFPSPTKSPTTNQSTMKKSLQILQGAVVYTDVHTTDGADASGIFVELLTQMGARCVKSWSWNPRISLSPVDGVEPSLGKVGITHVIFKDGGIRTLEKVRESNGLVKCVGVGWVLDCERENKWLDEADYSVDLSFIPRGGHKRRKSMEPRAISNMNGTIVKMDTSTSLTGGRRAGANWETLQEFRKQSPTSSIRRQSAEFDSSLTSDGHVPLPNQSDKDARDNTRNDTTLDNLQCQHVKPPASTPLHCHLHSPTFQPLATPDFGYAFDFDAAAASSPATPFYLSEQAKLIQQTCPPKQLRKGLFSESEPEGNKLSEGLRIRIEAARRKSLVWKPKVSSPLGKVDTWLTK